MNHLDLDIKLADRIWIAVATLHQQMPDRPDFTKSEIRQKLRELGLMEGLKAPSVAAHLKQHLVANVPPSSTKYRMLYETTPGGNLRLFRPGDFTYATRREGRRLSKSVPERDDLPPEYRPLLGWYEIWAGRIAEPSPESAIENDPLIRLIGSGQHIWADEHADEYVDNLRREDR
ncbi:MAG TPA: hypothetical protein VG893_10675 [Terracidiphilus sp.]|nr:hypothetical protein [Terracidiphilus sp.]